VSLAKMHEGVDAIAQLPGVVFCAMVEGATGLVIYSAGGSSYDPLAETASSYWKLGERMSDVFKDIGPQRALSVQLQGGVFSVMPCGEHTLLATLSRANGMDWSTWLAKVTSLSRELRM
jgi:hypothetical protein